MEAIKAITNSGGRDRCHHHDASKCSRNEPLEHDEEGRGDQPRSHKLPRRQTQQEHHKGGVSITMILTPRQQLSS